MLLLLEINEACQNAMENIPLSTLFCKIYSTLLASLLFINGAIILQVIYWKISTVEVHLKAVALNLSPDYSVVFLVHKLGLLIQPNYHISRCANDKYGITRYTFQKGPLQLA